MRIIYVNCVSRNKYESNLDSMKWNKKQKWKKIQVCTGFELMTTIVIIQTAPAPPPPHPLHEEHILPSQPSDVQPIHQGLIPAHFLLSLLFKHLRMFNAHIQFSLFLWYDNNVKQRYCYGCCAEIGSFMPQAVSFPEKTTVV